ncbi:MAG: YfiR family protein [Planctomycetota bacterium]|jgi:hypothetical protein
MARNLMSFPSSIVATALSDLGSWALGLARRAARTHVVLLLTMLVALTGEGREAAAQGSREREYEIKATWLVVFAKFCEWRDELNAEDEFVIGVLGPDPFSRRIKDDVERSTVGEGGTRIGVHQFLTIDDYKPPCRILFVSRRDERGYDRTRDAKVRLRQAVKRTEGSHVLIVSDLELDDIQELADLGVSINLASRRNQIWLQINKAAVDRADIEITERLMNLKHLEWVPDPQAGKRPAGRGASD